MFSISVLLQVFLQIWCTNASKIDSGDVVRQSFTVDSNYSFHFNMLIGTPSQMVTTYLDFATADLFMTSGMNPCVDTTCNPYATYESFQSNASSSYTSKNRYFTSALTSDSTLVSGIWSNDRVQIAGRTIDSLDFVFHGETSSSEGSSSSFGTSSYVPGTFFASYLGLGPRGLQQTVEWIDDNKLGPTYDSFLYKLPISSPSYSIWVDPATDTSGIITFGAVDSGQYIPGSLVNIPILSTYSSFDNVSDLAYIGVAVYSIDLNFETTDSTWINQTLFYCSDVAILNSRANFTLPAPYLRQIGTALAATWSGIYGFYLVPCGTRGTIELDISGFTFVVHLEELLVNINAVDEVGNAMCGLNIGVGTNIYLSNKVLKNYFLAVDYDKNQLSLGQRAYVGQVPTPSTVAINDDSISDATKAELYSYTILNSGRDLAVVLTYTGTPATYATTASSNYVLGGTPVPTVVPRAQGNETRTLAKATEASNVSPKLGSKWSMGILSLLFWLI